MSPRKLLRKINEKMTSALMVGHAILFMNENSMFITFKFTCGYVNTDKKYMLFINSDDDGSILVDPTDNLIARVFDIHHNLISDPETDFKILLYMLKQTINYVEDMPPSIFASNMSEDLNALIKKIPLERERR